MRKFFVFDEAKKGDANWDTFCGMFDTQEQAVEEAERIWRHLTESERKNRTVIVAHADVPDGEEPLDFALSDGYYCDIEIKAKTKPGYAGFWRGNPDIELFRASDGNLYALYGWNGEEFLLCWRVNADGDASEETYNLTPIYKYEEDGIDPEDLTDEEYDDSLNEIVDFFAREN